VFIDFWLARCAKNAKPDDSSFDSGTFLGGFFVQAAELAKQKKNRHFLLGATSN
jgi:hypothetical protein